LYIEKIVNEETNWEIGKKEFENRIVDAEVLINDFKPDSNNIDELYYYQIIHQRIQQIKTELNIYFSQTSFSASRDKTQFSKLILLFDDLQTDLNTLMGLQIKKALLVQENNQANFTKSKIYFAIILSIGVAISMTLALIILIGIKSYIRSLNRLIQKIASGDLSTIIVQRGGKEFGKLHESLKLLSDKFTEVLEISQTAANSVSFTSQEMSSNSQLISRGASQQAASIEEIATSMEQISGRIEENTANTLATQKISTKVVTDIKATSNNVKQTVEAIQSIASKISIIGDIAFQTNILALNAAVEAARAGEHGKGFGVVAAAVGKLAERSKTAAIDIDSLSLSGVDLALESHKILIQFVAEITETSNLISKITNANLEQNDGISDINSSIQVLNQITQQNAASSEELATVSEEMAAQAQILKESIQYFKFQEYANPSNKEQKYLNPANGKNK
jgi:methyl-accepting chemotaxis protein